MGHEVGISGDNIDNVLMEMLQLNLDAMSFRYNEPMVKVKEYYDIKRIKNQNIGVEEIQMVRSLSCLIYQCSEGDYPKTGIYKVMVELRNWIQYNFGITNKVLESSSCFWD